MPRTKNSVRRWTEEEDKLLEQALSQQDGGNVDWRQIACSIPGRSNKDCRKRWVYGISPLLNKGPWDDNEDARLREAVELHGCRWNLVSQFVVTRQPDQCSRRWRESVNPNINRNRWSLLEDAILDEAVRTYGKRWTEIVERYFPNRSPIAARQRYVQRFGKGVDDADEGNDHERARRSANPQLLWQVRDHTQQWRMPPPPDNELATAGDDGANSLWTDYLAQPSSLPLSSPRPPSGSPLDALGHDIGAADFPVAVAAASPYLLASNVPSPPSLSPVLELPDPQLLGMGHPYRGNEHRR